MMLSVAVPRCRLRTPVVAALVFTVGMAGVPLNAAPAWFTVKNDTLCELVEPAFAETPSKRWLWAVVMALVKRIVPPLPLWRNLTDLDPALFVATMVVSTYSWLFTPSAGMAMLGMNSSVVSPVYAPFPSVTGVGLDGITGSPELHWFRNAVPAVVVLNVQ